MDLGVRAINPPYPEDAARAEVDKHYSLAGECSSQYIFVSVVT
jgi:hypothetical protein